MADVIGLSSPSFHSLRFASSLLLTSFASTSSSLQPVLPPNYSLDRRFPPLSSCPVSSSSSSSGGLARLALAPRKQFRSFKVHATVAQTDQPKWWEKNAGPNMVDIHSTQEFLSALSQAGDRLVIVEFYGTWCASCRALFPKIIDKTKRVGWDVFARLTRILFSHNHFLDKTAEEHPEILFLKVNFDENKPMCKSLNVKVLPYFHFYRGVDGQLESFSCSLAKFQKIKDAIQMHNSARCSIGPPKGIGELTLESLSAASLDKPAA